MDKPIPSGNHNQTPFVFPDIEELFELYSNDILRVCNVYLRKRCLAEDAFQDVFIKAMTRSQTYRGETPIKFWLMQIARNVCKDYLKSAWFTKVGFYEDYAETEAGSSGFPEIADHGRYDDEENRIIDDIDSDSDLMIAVKALPLKYKDVILMRFYYDLSTSEIANQLNISENTVRSRLFRARKMLSPYISEDEI